MFKELMNRIDQAKRAGFPRESLFLVYGQIKMAWELEAITTAEFMTLNHECVAEGINNPKYF